MKQASIGKPGREGLIPTIFTKGLWEASMAINRTPYLVLRRQALIPHGMMEDAICTEVRHAADQCARGS